MVCNRKRLWCLNKNIYYNIAEGCVIKVITKSTTLINLETNLNNFVLINVLFMPLQLFISSFQHLKIRNLQCDLFPLKKQTTSVSY